MLVGASVAQFHLCSTMVLRALTRNCLNPRFPWKGKYGRVRKRVSVGAALPREGEADPRYSSCSSIPSPVQEQSTSQAPLGLEKY